MTKRGAVVGECEGEAVYARPQVGDMSHELHCKCGNRFCAPVLGIQLTGDGWPDVALANCTNCKSPTGFASTCAFDVEPLAPSSRIRRFTVAA